MKRFRCVLAGVLLIGGAVAGCGSSGKTAAAPTPSQTAPAPTPTPTPTPKPTPTPTPVHTPTPVPRLPGAAPLRVELWGDSISAVAAPYITSAIDKSGQATTRTNTYGGTALCDWFTSMRQELDPTDPNAFHPQVGVIQFSGDAFTPCMKDSKGVAYSGTALINKYASDSALAIALFAEYKVPVYFVSTPISRGEAALGYVGNTPLGVMFSKLPSRFPSNDLVRFTNAAAAVELNGHFTQTLPCETGEPCTGQWPDGTKTVVVRDVYGVHFCPVKEVSVNGAAPTCPVYMPGAFRFARAIATPIIRDFSLG